MGNKASLQTKNNFRKSAKLQKQKIDTSGRFSGFGFCYNGQREESQEIWLSHFKAECQDLVETCQWASQCLYALKKFEGYPVSHYQREVMTCNLLVSRGTSIQISETKTKKKKRDYDNLTPQMKYKKLYKKSDLIEEDPNGSNSLTSSLLGGVGGGLDRIKKSSSINSFSINNNYNNKASFSSINSNPSYVFPQYLLQRNDISNQNKEQIDALELYVLKTEIIAKHLQDPNNVLGHLTNIFLETFNNSFEGISKRLFDLKVSNQSTPGNEESQITQKAISEVQQFIRVMQETIQLFYNLSREFKRSNSEMKKNTNVNHFNRENMLNFVTSQLFRNQKMYEIIFTLIQLEDVQQEEILKQSMKKLIRKRPQDFYIQDRLCLNERTLVYYNKETTKYIKEEMENEFTGTESLHAVTEKDSNQGSDIKPQVRSKDKYKPNEYLVEENENDEDDGDNEVRYKRGKKCVSQEINNDDYDEEEKYNDEELEDYSETACQFGGVNQFMASKSKKKIGNLKKTKSQEYSKNQQANNQSPTNFQNQPRKSSCKEIEYYYTSSFDNQIELFKETNLNNSQPQHPFSSKEANHVYQEDSDDGTESQHIISEKPSEENQKTSSSSSALEESKESSSTSRNDSSNQVNIVRENVSSDEPDKRYFENLKKESYYRCLKYILKIQKQQSPIGKMKMIVRASEHILTCINNFYKNHGITQNNFLDADDVLSLFSYFSCKSYIYSMNTHIKLVNKFITSNLINSVSGYYLTTLCASLQNILEFQNGSILQQVIEV